MNERPLIETRAYPDRVLTDRHPYHQLLLGQQGCLELEADGRGVHVAAGVLAPIPAGPGLSIGQVLTLCWFTGSLAYGLRLAAAALHAIMFPRRKP